MKSVFFVAGVKAPVTCGWTGLYNSSPFSRYSLKISYCLWLNFMVSWVLGIVFCERNSGSPTLSRKDFLVGSLHFVVLTSCCDNNQIETGFLYLFTFI